MGMILSFQSSAYVAPSVFSCTEFYRAVLELYAMHLDGLIGFDDWAISRALLEYTRI